MNLTKQENRYFIIASSLAFIIYFGIIQLYLVVDRYLSHTDKIANNEYIYNTIRTNAEVSYYSKIIPIDIILLIFLSIALFVIIGKLKDSDCYKNHDTYRYLKVMIKENGAYIGLILLSILVLDYSIADSDRAPRVYLALRTKDIPHILYIIPSLTAPLLMWLGLDLRRERKVDYLALAVFIIWMLMLVLLTIVIILFYDSDFHMT